MIKSRGEKIAPREIEEVLYAVDGVRDAAVIGIPDELLGTADPRLRVALRGRRARRARAAAAPARQRLEDYMVPAADRDARDELPRNTAGKIDKLRLTELSKAEIAQV